MRDPVRYWVSVAFTGSLAMAFTVLLVLGISQYVSNSAVPSVKGMIGIGLSVGIATSAAGICGILLRFKVRRIPGKLCVALTVLGGAVLLLAAAAGFIERVLRK